MSEEIIKYYIVFCDTNTTDTYHWLYYLFILFKFAKLVVNLFVWYQKSILTWF